MLPVEPRVVERWFSRTWYPPLQRVLTPLANAVGWSLFDVTCVAVGVAAVTMVVTRVRGAKGAARKGRWWRAAFDLVALGAAVYLVFMATWGWHYRREPLGARLDVHADGVTAERVRELTDTAIFHLNSLHASAHARAWPSPVAWATGLAPAFGAAQQALGVEPAAVPARPKPTAFGAWFVRAGIAGMTNPFQLDVMLTPDALPFEVPAMLAHEWAHVAGFAREDEAGFVGFVTTQQGDMQAQYQRMARCLRPPAGGVAARRARRHASPPGRRTTRRPCRHPATAHAGVAGSPAGRVVGLRLVPEVESCARRVGEL